MADLVASEVEASEAAVPAEVGNCGSSGFGKTLNYLKNKDIKKTQQLLGFLFRPNYLEPKLKRN